MRPCGHFHAAYSERRRLILRLIGFALFLLVIASPASQAQPSRGASAADYLERGNEWMAKGDFDRAIADYGFAIAFDSRSAVAHYNRGLARRRKGDLVEALNDYNRAIEL